MKLLVLVVTMFLLFFSFVSAETVSDGLFTVNTLPVQAAGQTSDANYNVYAMVTDMAGITSNLDNVVCVGLMCQFFPKEEEVPVIPGGGVVGGGAGGNITPWQGNIVDINMSLNQCIKEGGTPVNIKGGLFCNKQNVYYPIAAVTGFNLGAMLIHGNPTLGWVILAFIVAGFILFVVEEKAVVDRRDVRLLKRYKRAERERGEEELTGEEEQEPPRNYYG